jgi:hypothetical protein
MVAHGVTGKSEGTGERSLELTCGLGSGAELVFCPGPRYGLVGRPGDEGSSDRLGQDWRKLTKSQSQGSRLHKSGLGLGPSQEIQKN